MTIISKIIAGLVLIAIFSMIVGSLCEGTRFENGRIYNFALAALKVVGILIIFATLGSLVAAAVGILLY